MEYRVKRLALVLAAAVAFAAAMPWFVDDYTTATLSRLLVLGLVGVSVALLTGVTGLPTLGQTAPFAAGAYTAAHVDGPARLLVAIGVGAVFALLTAPLVVYARGVYVLMITLAIGELAIIVAGRWKSVTGGTDGLIATATLDTDRSRYLYALAVAAVVVALVLLVLRSPAGLLLRASRDDEARMRASGHPVTAYLTGAYVVAGGVDARRGRGHGARLRRPRLALRPAARTRAAAPRRAVRGDGLPPATRGGGIRLAPYRSAGPCRGGSE
jgi:branched-chain amino acid transport system permease protein